MFVKGNVLFQISKYHSNPKLNIFNINYDVESAKRCQIFFKLKNF